MKTSISMTMQDHLLQRVPPDPDLLPVPVGGRVHWERDRGGLVLRDDNTRQVLLQFRPGNVSPWRIPLATDTSGEAFSCAFRRLEEGFTYLTEHGIRAFRNVTYLIPPALKMSVERSSHAKEALGRLPTLSGYEWVGPDRNLPHLGKPGRQPESGWDGLVAVADVVDHGRPVHSLFRTLLPGAVVSDFWCIEDLLAALANTGKFLSETITWSYSTPRGGLRLQDKPLEDWF